MKKKRIYTVPLLVGVLVCSMIFQPLQVMATGEGVETGGEVQEETEPPIPESYYLPIESNDIAGWPAGPQIEAESAIVMEANTGAILYAKNIEAKQYPASITKMMTGLLGVEYGQPDKKMKLSEYAVFSIEPGSSHVGLQPGEKITMQQALYGLMLESGNDAANGIAEKVAGSVNAFVQMMNDRAAALGCTNTHFENAHGLHSENHYTCAKDMALISAEAFRNPTFVEIAGASHYEVPETNKVDEIRYWVNHHAMISKESRRYEGCLGGKTGYTSDALNTLVTCAEREGMKLVCVVLRVNGSDKALDETKALLDYGFDNFNMTETVNEDASMKRSDLLGLVPFGEGRKLRDAVLDEQVVQIEGKTEVVLPKGADAGQLERTISAGNVNYCFGGWQVGKTSISFTPVDYEIPEPEAPETEPQQAAAEIEKEMPETEEQDIWRNAVSSVKNACYTAAEWIYENDVFAALAVLVLILMLLPLLAIAYVRDRSSRKIRKARQREREERTKIEKEIDSKTVSEIEAELRANLERESTAAEKVEDDSLEQDSEDKEGNKNELGISD